MRVQSNMPIPKACDVCGASGVVYRESKATFARLNYKPFGFYACVAPRCNALVTCNPNSIYPSGLMAKKEVRQLRIEAHAAFDPLWECVTAKWSRNEAYEWVAVTLEVPLESCNISRLSKEKLLELIERAKAEYQKQFTTYRRRKNKKAKRAAKREKDEIVATRKHTLLRTSGTSKQRNDSKQLDFKRKLRDTTQ